MFKEIVSEERTSPNDSFSDEDISNLDEKNIQSVGIQNKRPMGEKRNLEEKSAERKRLLNVKRILNLMSLKK